MLQERMREREEKRYVLKYPRKTEKETSNKTTLFVERLKKVLPIAGRELKNQAAAIVMTALETEGIYKFCNHYIIEMLVDGILIDKEMRESARIMAERVIKAA